MSVLKPRDMSNDELVHFFELWARGRKNVEQVKAEILRRLPNPSPAPEVMGTRFSDRLAEIADESVTHLTAELAPPKGLFLCNCCGLCAEESKAQLNHAQSCPIGQILKLIRERPTDGGMN